ncbi:MAG: DUF2589 domain-containing protein [Acidobacteriota bacterium]
MPALDTSAAQVALGQLSALPFKNLIGGPLNASIEAQAQAAQTTVDFIQSVGFNEIDGELEPIYVEFIFQDSIGFVRRVKVPLLLIVPIPFIVIDNVAIQFKARISASAGQQTETRRQTAKSASATGRFRFWGQRLDITGSISSKKDSKASQESKYSVEYTMDVNVNASQAGIPQGMAEVLNILQEGISNTPSQTRIEIFSLPALLTTEDGTTFTGSGVDFKVLVLDSRGEPVENAEVAVTASNGLVAPPGVAPTTDAEGLATVAITPVTAALPSEGDADETLQVTVTAPSDDEGTTLSRSVKVRNAA